MANAFQVLLQKIIGYPSDVPVTNVVQAATNQKLTVEQQDQLSKIGMIFGDLQSLMSHQTLINYERSNIYRETDRALTHPIMAAAMEFYAEVATAYDRVQNATVWISSKSREYQSQLERLFDIINLEERIFDWAYTTATYGDMFIRINAKPGVGIVSINDDDHPINISRVDYEGRLIGFYNTPLGSTSDVQQAKMIAPWEVVHFRLLGVKKKRPLYDDPMYTEYRTITIMVPETKQLTAKYGTSIALNGLPIYKRLRLAEDSIMLARLSRGTLKYLYKVKVTGSNMEAVSTLVEQYKTMLKRARSMDTSKNSPFFSDKTWELAPNEDIIIPVFSDNVNDVAVEKLGGEVDIKWIADIEELRNQLAIALRVPLQLLGGYVDEMPASLGKSSAEQMDIRFARSARRLQRAVIEGIKRMCQIHLAYMNMNPDVKMFEINMAETSTAEEIELREALDKGADVVDKLVKLILEYGDPTIDRNKLLDYFNKKLLKLNDLELDKLSRKIGDKMDGPAGNVPMGGEVGSTPSAQPEVPAGAPAPLPPLESKQKIEEKMPRKNLDASSDLYSFLPGDKFGEAISEAVWRAKYEKLEIKVKDDGAK